jgi:hypothetical protein
VAADFGGSSEPRGLTWEASTGENWPIVLDVLERLAADEAAREDEGAGVALPLSPPSPLNREGGSSVLGLKP